MNNSLVKITVFGELGKYLGYETWDLAVSSVSEGIRSLDILTKGKFNDYFIKKNKLGAKYRVLINGEDFTCPDKELNGENWEKVYQSELVMKKKDLKTIDIVPLIESSGTKGGGIFSAILGAILIIVGIFLIGTPFGVPLIIAGLGLLAAGVVALLSKPPSFNFNQNLDNSTSQSYLFNGPTNTVGEGNPVPIGYGTTLVGSNVVSAGYKVTIFNANST